MDRKSESTSQSIEPLDEQAILSAIRDEVEWAESESSERENNREEAADYFYARLPGPPNQEECDQGMSQVVSTDVQDAVFAVQAELMPAFTGQSPVEFEPLSDQDEAQASVETRAVNHAARNAGIYMAVNNAVLDVLLRRAGVVKVYWDQHYEVEFEDVEGVPEQLLPQVLQPRPNDIEVVPVEGTVDDQGMASGRIRRKFMCSRPRIEAVPLDEFLVSGNLTSPDLSNARFKAHQRPVTRSDLVKMGMPKDKVLELKDITAHFTGRSRTYAGTDLRAPDTMGDYVMVVESYYQLDVDRDGIAEHRRIITGGGSEGTDELLYNEPVNGDPFALGVGYLGLYSWDGVSLFDRLKMVQDVKTDLIRETVNLTKRALRQRVGAVENDANMDDVLTSMLGGVIRLRTPNGLVPIQEVNIPPMVFQLIEYLDDMRKDKGGSAIDATASAQVLGQGGDWSLERLMSAIEQLNAMVAKNITETMIKDIYRKLHRLLRTYQREPMNVPGSAGWEQTDPQQWNPREDMVLSMGMSVGERSTRIGALQGIVQRQAEDAAAGLSGILTDLNGMYQARVDMARMAGLPNPEQYFVDPASPQSMQAQQQQAQQAELQQQQLQAQQQEMMRFQYGLMTDLERIRNEGKLAQQAMQDMVERFKADLKAATDTFAQRVKLVEIEQKGDQAEAQLEIDRLQARRAVNG